MIKILSVDKKSDGFHTQTDQGHIITPYSNIPEERPQVRERVSDAQFKRWLEFIFTIPWVDVRQLNHSGCTVLALETTYHTVLEAQIPEGKREPRRLEEMPS